MKYLAIKLAYTNQIKSHRLSGGFFILKNCIQIAEQANLTDVCIMLTAHISSYHANEKILNDSNPFLNIQSHTLILPDIVGMQHASLIGIAIITCINPSTAGWIS